MPAIDPDDITSILKARDASIENDAKQAKNNSKKPTTLADRADAKTRSTQILRAARKKRQDRLAALKKQRDDAMKSQSSPNVSSQDGDGTAMAKLQKQAIGQTKDVAHGLVKAKEVGANIKDNLKATIGPRNVRSAEKRISKMADNMANIKKTAKAKVDRVVDSKKTQISNQIDKLKKKREDRRKIASQTLARDVTPAADKAKKAGRAFPNIAASYIPTGAEVMTEKLSNWREGFIFEVDDKKETKEKLIQPLKGTNTITINPDEKKIGESVELTESFINSKIEDATEFFLESGLNEDGLDILVDLVGVDTFTDFVLEDSSEELNEARRGGVRIEPVSKTGKKIAGMKKGGGRTTALKYPKSQKAERKAAEKAASEAKPSGLKDYLKSQETKKTVQPASDKKPAKVKVTKVKKVKKSTKVAKQIQPAKKASKETMRSRVTDWVKKGVKRHQDATAKAKSEVKKIAKTASDTAKQHSQHRKDLVSGLKATKKEKKIAGGIAKGVKKALTGEEVEIGQELKSLIERPLSSTEEDKKEDIVKGMKKNYSGFRERYGSDAKSVMYATATKLAKEEVGISSAAAMEKAKKENELRRKEQEAVEKAKKSLKKEEVQLEAKVDAGKDDEGKEDARNTRKFGHVPYNKHGHSVLRRSLHRMRRGDKKIKGNKEVNVETGKVGKEIGEEVVTERLGGKGYSRKAGASGIHKTSGDWPDSDRGAGNKAKRRSGGKVEKKSPTYLAHVHNKEEVEIQDAQGQTFLKVIDIIRAEKLKPTPSVINNPESLMQ